MTTVSELRAWLKDLPPDATVRLVEMKRPWGETYMALRRIDVHSTYVVLRP